ncbi:MAG: LysM peptidoglycan-binding domain-containing protein [Acidimicrobiia bacterium]
MPDYRGTSTRAKAAAVAVGIAMVVAAASSDYVVQQGDTLAQIARQNDTSVGELVEANDIEDPHRIFIGQRLIIPGAGTGTTDVHTVATGENLASIAQRYRTTVRAIVEANDLADPDLIVIGQRLVVPGGDGGSRVHVVSAGESLAAIADRYDLTIEEIASANGITDVHLIHVGNQLRLSGESFVAEGGGSTSLHVVAAGENLGDIARRYGTSIAKLAEHNGISNPNLIRIGEELAVPGGGWRCPVEGASFFNDWGFPRSGGRFHEGNDLFAPGGTPVVAPVSGRVEHLIGTIGGYQFRLQGDDGHLYIGTHLDGFGEAGKVAAGTVIGYVGDTGNARGSLPHLHFEIRPDGGEATNPYPTLVKFCR